MLFEFAHQLQPTQNEIVRNILLMKSNDLIRAIKFHLRGQSLSARQLATRLDAPTSQVNRALYKGLGSLFQKTLGDATPPQWSLQGHATMDMGVFSHEVSLRSQLPGSDLHEDTASQLLIYQKKALQLRATSPDMAVPPLIEGLGLSNRSRKALSRRKITTTTELLAASPVELLQIPNFGVTSLMDVARCCSRWGIWFGDDLLNTAADDEVRYEFEDDWQQWLTLDLSPELIATVKAAQARANRIRVEQPNTPVPLLVEKLGFNRRASNCLRQAMIVTTEELLQSKPNHLLDIKNFGSQTLIDVTERLSFWGIWFETGIDQIQWSDGHNLHGPEFGNLPGAERIDEIISHIRMNSETTPEKIGQYFDIPLHLINQLLATYFGVDVRKIEGRIRKEFKMSNEHRKERTRNERLNRIIEMRSNGYTLEEIGDQFGLSRERIRQLIAKSVGAEEATALYRSARKSARQKEVEKLQSLFDDWDGVFPVSTSISEALTAALNCIRDSSNSSGYQWRQAVEEWLYTNPGSSAEEFKVGTGISTTTGKTLGGEAFERFVIRENTWAKRSEDADLLNALRQAATYEYPLSANKFTELTQLGEIDAPSAQTVIIRFGSWNAACKIAGVEGHEPPSDHYIRKWSDRDMWLIVERFLLLDGHRASYQDFEIWLSSQDDLPSAARVRQVLGGWAGIKRAIYLSSSFRESLTKHRLATLTL